MCTIWITTEPARYNNTDITNVHQITLSSVYLMLVSPNHSAKCLFNASRNFLLFVCWSAPTTKPLVLKESSLNHSFKRLFNASRNFLPFVIRRPIPGTRVAAWSIQIAFLPVCTGGRRFGVPVSACLCGWPSASKPRLGYWGVTRPLFPETPPLVTLRRPPAGFPRQSRRPIPGEHFPSPGFPILGEE